MRRVDQYRHFAVFHGGGGIADAIVLVEMKELAGGTEDGVAVDAFGFEEMKKVDGGGGVDGDVVVIARGNDGGKDSAERFFLGGHYPKG